MVERHAGRAWLVAGSTLLFAPCAAVVIASVGFALEQPLAAWQGVVAVLGALGFSLVVAGALGESRDALVGSATLIAVLVLGAALSACVYDLGFDSQSYHQLAITELANGWNPFREPAEVHGEYAIFVAHYSTGTWIQDALAFLVTRDFESAKVVNVVALAASFCLCHGALLYTGVARGTWAALAALAAALNPVALVQVVTFYVDGYLASMLVSLAAILLLVVMRFRAMFLALSAMPVILVAGAKFTGVVYPLPFIGVAGALLLRRTRSWIVVRRFTAVHVVAYLVAVGGVGFHPYVTNTLAYGHPFYPLRGPAQARDVAPLRPAALGHGEGRFERLVRSVFADPASPWSTSEHVYKVPLAVSRNELLLYGTPDARLGGWGPLFSGALVLSLGVAMPSFVRTRREGVALGLVTLAVITSALTNSECWWARLAPQLAFVPVVVALFAAASGRHRGAAAVLALTLANAALVVAAELAIVPRRSAAVERTLDELVSAQTTVYISDRWIAPLRRLRDKGIPFRTVRDDGSDPDPHLAARLPCGPVRRFPGTMEEIGYCAGHGHLVASRAVSARVVVNAGVVVSAGVRSGSNTAEEAAPIALAARSWIGCLARAIGGLFHHVPVQDLPDRARERYSMARERYSMARERYSMTRERYSMARERYSMARRRPGRGQLAGARCR